jgi:hypothetical protein
LLFSAWLLRTAWMAQRRKLPGFYEKRKILFGAKTTPEKMRETGKLFMDAARHDEALEFFGRCAAEDLTRQIAAEAMAAGDAPLFMRAKKVLKEQVTDEEWTRLAGNAEKAGAHSMAYVAHLRAGHAEEAARLRPRGQVPEEPTPEPLKEGEPSAGEPADK